MGSGDKELGGGKGEEGDLDDLDSDELGRGEHGAPLFVLLQVKEKANEHSARTRIVHLFKFRGWDE